MKAAGKTPARDTFGLTEAELTPRVRETIAKLGAEIATLKARLESLEAVADQDGLLPILNRRAFVREIARTISFADRYGLSASLIYFDLDGLKSINDTHGHAAGDAALRHVAEVIADNIRKSDILGRLGGDEFGVILPKADHSAADKKARALAKLLAAKPFVWQHQQRALTVACGVHSLVKNEDPEVAIAHADKAMYAAKRTSRA